MVTHAEAKRGQLIAAIEKVAVPDGWDPLAIVTHATHETGHFNHMVGINNYWGIKVPRRRPWDGMVVKVPTTEIFKDTFRFCRFINRNLAELLELTYQERVVMRDRGGVKVPIKERLWYIKLNAKFCDWPSDEDAVLYFMDLIKRVYPDAYLARANAPDFFNGLVSGRLKWATDPEYIKKLLRLYEQLKGSNDGLTIPASPV